MPRPCWKKPGAEHRRESAPLKTDGADGEERRLALFGHWDSPSRYIAPIFRVAQKSHDALQHDFGGYIKRLDAAFGDVVTEGSDSAKRVALYMDGRIGADGKLTKHGRDAVDPKTDERVLRDDYGALNLRELKASDEARRVLDELFDRLNEGRETPIPYRQNYITYLFDRTGETLRKSLVWKGIPDRARFPFEKPRNDPRLLKELDVVKSMHAYLPAAMKKIHYEPMLKELIEYDAQGKATGGMVWKLYSGNEKKSRYAEAWIRQVVGEDRDEAPAAISDLIGAVRKWTGRESKLDGKPLTGTSIALAITGQTARATMGFNLGTALRNAIGGIPNLVMEMSRGDGFWDAMWNGVHRTGIGMGRFLSDEAGAWLKGEESIAHQEDVLGSFRSYAAEVMARKGIMRKFDKAAFKLLNMTEFFLRGTAFHAGLAEFAAKEGKALDAFSPEKLAEAVAHGHRVADEANFIYGAFNRAPRMNVPMGRVFSQFAHWNMQQLDFTGEKIERALRGVAKGELDKLAPVANGVLTLGLFSWALSSVGIDSGFLTDWFPGAKIVKEKLSGKPQSADIQVFGVPVADVGFGPGADVLATLVSGDGDGALRKLSKLIVPGNSAVVNLAKGARSVAKGGVTEEIWWKSLPEQVLDMWVDQQTPRTKYRHGVGRSRPVSLYESMVMASGLRTTREEAESALSEVRRRASDLPAEGHPGPPKSRAERTAEGIRKSARSYDALRTELDALGF